MPETSKRNRGNGLDRKTLKRESNEWPEWSRAPGSEAEVPRAVEHPLVNCLPMLLLITVPYAKVGNVSST
jgi:hypothetical protein